MVIALFVPLFVAFGGHSGGWRRMSTPPSPPGKAAPKGKAETAKTEEAEEDLEFSQLTFSVLLDP